MRPAMHSPIEQHLNPVSDGIDDFCQLVERAAGAVKLTTAVIRHDDSGAADVDGFFGIIDAHDSFQAELAVPMLDHFSNIAPVHRRVEHCREIVADRGRTSGHGNVVLELRQSKSLVRQIVDCPLWPDGELKHTLERQSQWNRKAGAKIAFAIAARDRIYRKHHNGYPGV